VIARLNTSVRKALDTPDIRDKLEQQGVETEASTPEAFGQIVSNDIEKWRKIITTAKIKAE
jgi:tripartite-type tricarboxylate transporter receptor subunit TctC